MHCPNCNTAQADGIAECAACGVIFAKWRAPEQRRQDAPAVEPRGPSRGLSWPLLGGATVAGLCLWFFLKPQAPAPTPGGGASPAAPQPQPEAQASPAESVQTADATQPPASSGSADPGWLRRACERTLELVEPAKLRVQPNCAGAPEATIEGLRYHHYKTPYLVPAAEVTQIEVQPRVSGYTHGPDGRLDIEVQIILRNSIGDMVSSEGKLDISALPDHLVDRKLLEADELLRGMFAFTDRVTAVPVIEARLQAFSFKKPTAQGESIIVGVVFNGTLHGSGRLPLDEYLPARAESR